MFPLNDLSILFTALLIIAFAFLGLFVLFGLLICKSLNKNRCPPHQIPVVPTPPPDTEITLATLNQKIDTYHAEDIKRANKDRYERISFIAWGFALSTLGLAIAVLKTSVGVWVWVPIVVFMMATAFFIIGWIANDNAKKYK